MIYLLSSIIRKRIYFFLNNHLYDWLVIMYNKSGKFQFAGFPKLHIRLIPKKFKSYPLGSIVQIRGQILPESTHFFQQTLIIRIYEISEMFTKNTNTSCFSGTAESPDFCINNGLNLYSTNNLKHGFSKSLYNK